MYVRFCVCAPLFYATNSVLFFCFWCCCTVATYTHNLLWAKTKEKKMKCTLLLPMSKDDDGLCFYVCVCVCAKQNLKINNMPNCVCTYVCVYVRIYFTNGCTRQCISNSTAIRNALQAHTYSHSFSLSLLSALTLRRRTLIKLPLPRWGPLVPLDVL